MSYVYVRNRKVQIIVNHCLQITYKIILHLKKTQPDTHIINVIPTYYRIVRKFSHYLTYSSALYKKHVYSSRNHNSEKKTPALNQFIRSYRFKEALGETPSTLLMHFPGSLQQAFITRVPNLPKFTILQGRQVQTVKRIC